MLLAGGGSDFDSDLAGMNSNDIGYLITWIGWSGGSAIISSFLAGGSPYADLIYSGAFIFDANSKITESNWACGSAIY